MREIKFRVWDDNNEDMDYWGLQDRDYYACDGEERYHIMQYIGLKDKNGKEIYKGDVIKYKLKNRLKTEKAEIKWDDDFAGFMPFVDYDSDDLTSYVDMKTVEIIGNIYENPELVKK